MEMGAEEAARGQVITESVGPVKGSWAILNNGKAARNFSYQT